MTSTEVHRAGLRLAAALSSLKISQTDAAKAAGVSRSYINDVVHGRVPPSDNLLLALHTSLGIAPEWVRWGRGDAMTSTTEVAEVDEARLFVEERQDVQYGAADRMKRLRALITEVDSILGHACLAAHHNADLHALLDDAVPANATVAERFRVRGFLESMVWERNSRK